MSEIKIELFIDKNELNRNTIYWYRIQSFAAIVSRRPDDEWW